MAPSGLIQPCGFTTWFNSTGVEQMLENLSMPKSFLRSFLPSAEILDPEYPISPAKLPFRDRSVLVKDTGHRSGTSERKLLQAGFGEFKTEAGPIR